MRQEANHGENHQAGEEWRADVANRDDQRVLVAVVRELVVRAQRYQSAPSWTEGEEYLHGSVTPDFRRGEATPVRRQVEEDALLRAWKHDAADEQGDLEVVVRERMVAWDILYYLIF